MLVSGKQMLRYTRYVDIAIPAFGFINLEGAIAIVSAAEELNMPVILQLTESSMKYGGMENLFYIAKTIADNANIPIAIHYDYGTDIDNIKKSIDLGFTSVMYDCSKLSIDENIKNILVIKKYIGDKDISLEIGVIVSEEDITEYANFKKVLKICNQCDPDMIAIIVDSISGIRQEPININYELIKLVAMKTNKPIVLHGLNGISSENIVKSIKAGVKKANFDTEIKQAYINSIIKYMKENVDECDLRKIFSYAMESQTRVARKRINDCMYENRLNLL